LFQVKHWHNCLHLFYDNYITVGIDNQKFGLAISGLAKSPYRISRHREDWWT